MTSTRAATIFSMFVLALVSAMPLHATAPDATLYTSYEFFGNYQTIDWFVCGSTLNTEGCYAAGSLGPFGQAGALIEGNPSSNLKTGTVTRDIYVVDDAAGTTGTGVTLYVYKKTDVVTASTDTVTVSLIKTVPLSLTGGTTAVCSMAADNKFLFIGTNLSPNVLRVEKSNYTITEIGGFEPPINVTAITADKYGYVIVTFGGLTASENANIEFDPNGNTIGDGGGAWFTLNTAVGLSPATVPVSNVQSTRRLEVHPKVAAQSQ